MKSVFVAGLLHNPRVVFGSVWLMAVLVAAMAAPLFAPGDPFALVGQPLSPPWGDHLLGTDSLGRSVYAGIIHGTRATLLIASVSTVSAVLLGTLVGAIAGYYESVLSKLLMRVTDIFQTIPSFVFAIVLVAILSPSLWSLSVAIAVTSWPPIARMVRAEVLSMKSREFVQAAVVLGRSDLAILMREVLPNVLSPLIVTASLLIATAILVESALSFLGLGAPNVMSWGFIIGAGRSFMRDAWWVVTMPGIAILLTVLAINLVGEGLNDVLNPRLRS
jgi:peptide/nickel transport system permease protein